MAIQTIKHSCPLGGTSKTKITKVKNCIISMYHTVPISNQHLVHLLNVLERTFGEMNDICMIKMRIRCKERMFCIKF